MRKTKKRVIFMLCFCAMMMSGIFTSVKVNATEAADKTFDVLKEGYTLTYKVLDEENVSLTDVTKTSETESLPVEMILDDSVEGTIDGVKHTYNVTQIADQAFADCSTKKYVIPTTVTLLVGNPFEEDDVVVLKKIYQMNGLSAEPTISFGQDFYEGVYAILICGDSTSIAIAKDICNVGDGDLPESIIPIEGATESTIANYSILALKNGANTTGMIREENKLSTATVPMMDYVTEKGVSGTIKWEAVDDVQPENYTVSSNMFTNGVTTDSYAFSYTAGNYVPFEGSVKLANTLVTITEGAFNFKFELFENEEGSTAVLLKAELVNSADTTTTKCIIPSKVTVNNKEYTVNQIASAAFSGLGQVKEYVIPDTIQTVVENAFYNTSDSSISGRVILLRIQATDVNKLPEIRGSYQRDDNKGNRMAIIVDKALAGKENDLRNKYGNLVGWNDEFLKVAETNVLTDNIMYGGSKTIPTDVYYDPSTGKNTMAYVVQNTVEQASYKDFLTNVAVPTVVSWNGKESYVFNYPDGAQNFPYAITALGYISINKSQQFDPQSLSGFTYKLVNGTLCVTGYKGSATELVLSKTEADAYNTYSVTGIGGRSLTDSKYQKLTIPSTITSIEPDAFVGANYMKVVVEAGNPYFIAIDDFLYSADKTTLIAAPSASGHVSLPEGTIKLGNYAFAGSSRVLSVIIPSTVTMIGTTNNGAYTFAWMRGFETIKFSSYNPAALTIMGNHMVEGSSLREVYYPEGTTAAYTAVMQGAGIYFGDGVSIKEWRPTYNTIVSMDGTEVKYVNPVDSTKTYTWTSSNPDVVIVEVSGTQGKLTAVGNGEAIITATAADGTTYKWTVNVTLSETVYKTAFPVSNIVLGKKDGKKTDQVTINTVSVPRGTTLASVSVKNKKIATVKLTKDKKGIIITSAGKTGKTTVTVTDANGKTATMTVTVKKAPTAKTFKLAKTSVKIKKGETYQIKLKSSVACQKVTYSLTKAAKKIVSVDSTGLVTAKKKGKAKITVKSYNGKTATLTVTVK
ncbi:MAG: leucine-rich repeat protein [Lachnospiraceae bacterium]